MWVKLNLFKKPKASEVNVPLLFVGLGANLLGSLSATCLGLWGGAKGVLGFDLRILRCLGVFLDLGIWGFFWCRELMDTWLGFRVK